MLGRGGGVQWLAVFLGNPGPRYASTRHNAGFMAADALAKDKGVSVTRLRFRALTAQCPMGEEQVLLMKPQTYMNESGQAVGQAARFYKIPPERVLVVSDDIHLPCGQLRIRPTGSPGAPPRRTSSSAPPGRQDFPRIRIGVGAPSSGGQEQIDWVLEVPRNQDWELFSDACVRAAHAAEDYIRFGPDKAMNTYNR
ncbi:MAG: aminoacyl-tRNA hydrolase [Oscillospiraceae bacterium]|nr:aminoacyl-tRNA hydrolase [Oscillospiraceae bacterium]